VLALASDSFVGLIGGYLAACHEQHSEFRGEIIVHPQTTHKDAIKQIKHHCPDALIAQNAHGYDHEGPHYNLCRELKIGFAALDISPAQKHISGMLADRINQNELAVDTLHTLLVRKNHGLAPAPFHLQIPSAWNESTTL
jgi:DNA-binding LacI/PurR family transcriptional regulator